MHGMLILFSLSSSAEFHGLVRRAGRVRRIGVGADFIAETLGDGRAAHHNLDLIADPRFLGGLDDVAHDAHGGGQKRAEADKAAMLFLRRFDEASGATSVPRSTTSRPLPSSISLTRFLPIS